MVTLWIALIGGLAAFPHCVGMCGGFALHVSSGRGAGAVGRHFAWQAGRVTSYVFLGALAGYCGSVASVANWPFVRAAVGYVVAAAMMLMGLGVLGLLPWRAKGPRSSEAAGTDQHEPGRTELGRELTSAGDFAPKGREGFSRGRSPRKAVHSLTSPEGAQGTARGASRNWAILSPLRGFFTIESVARGLRPRPKPQAPPGLAQSISRKDTCGPSSPQGGGKDFAGAQRVRERAESRGLRRIGRLDLAAVPAWRNADSRLSPLLRMKTSRRRRGQTRVGWNVLTLW